MAISNLSRCFISPIYLADLSAGQRIDNIQTFRAPGWRQAGEYRQQYRNAEPAQ
jgi:hypothetical protein